MSGTYAGLLSDQDGGLTPWGQVVMDAWVLGLLPETEHCAGWEQGRMQGLYERVYKAWEPYGHLPSQLPEEMRQRHTRIYAAAVARARDAGWQPELSEND